MSKWLLAALLSILLISCDRPAANSSAESNQNAEGKMDPWEDTLRKVHVGLTEEEVDAIIKPISLRSEKITWGNEGAFRKYYQLSAEKQTWVEIGGNLDKSKKDLVSEVGPVEPLSDWSQEKQELPFVGN